MVETKTNVMMKRKKNHSRICQKSVTGSRKGKRRVPRTASPAKRQKRSVIRDTVEKRRRPAAAAAARTCAEVREIGDAIIIKGVRMPLMELQRVMTTRRRTCAGMRKILDFVTEVMEIILVKCYMKNFRET